MKKSKKSARNLAIAVFQVLSGSDASSPIGGPLPGKALYELAPAHIAYRRLSQLSPYEWKHVLLLGSLSSSLFYQQLDDI